ncbi:MAG: zinc ribbon domain-containing protein [Chthoniobacterales bacterium]
MADPALAGDKQCPQCGFTNAATRTFCQDCGARITGGSGKPVPSGARPTDAEGHTTAPPRPTKKKQRSKIRPDRERSSPVRVFASLIRIILYAALIAALIQAFRTPDNLPTATAMSDEVAQNFRDRLADVANDPGGESMTFPWILINGYLAERVPPTRASDGFIPVEFVRVVAMPAEDEARIVMERLVYGHSLYVAVDLRPVSRGNGGTTARITGGSLGRLPLPGFIANLFTGTFRPVEDRLATELNTLSDAQTISIGPDAATATY